MAADDDTVDATADLEAIRTDLRRKREYLNDPELRERVHDWIAESYERLDVETVSEFMSSKLSGMLAEYDMYNSSAVDAGGEAFPDSCADCEHYGTACPVLVGPVEPEFRERKLAEVDTEADQRRIYEQQAVDTGCVRIPAFLGEWDSEHAAFIRRGEELLHEAEEHLLDVSAFQASQEAEVNVDS